MLSNSDGGVLNSPQKLIGGGLIGLVLFGLLIAFVTAPTGFNAVNNSANDQSMSSSSSKATTSLNIDGAPELEAVSSQAQAQPHAHSASSSSRMRLQVEPPSGVHRPPPMHRALPPDVVRSLSDAAAANGANSASSASDSKSGAAASAAGTDDSDSAAAAAPETGANVVKTLNLSDEGSSVTVAVGQRVALRLKENRTTGYGWQLEDRDAPTKHGVSALPADGPVALVTDESVKPLANPRRIGAGGEHVFVFEAKHAGTADLFATYRRPWLQPDTSRPASTFHFRIVVSDDDHTA